MKFHSAEIKCLWMGPPFVAAIGAVLAAAKPAGLQIAPRTVPLAEIESAWTPAEDARRVVFIP